MDYSFNFKENRSVILHFNPKLIYTFGGLNAFSFHIHFYYMCLPNNVLMYIPDKEFGANSILICDLYRKQTPSKTTKIWSMFFINTSCLFHFNFQHDFACRNIFWSKNSQEFCKAALLNDFICRFFRNLYNNGVPFHKIAGAVHSNNLN